VGARVASEACGKFYPSLSDWRIIGPGDVEPVPQKATLPWEAPEATGMVIPDYPDTGETGCDLDFTSATATLRSSWLEIVVVAAVNCPASKFVGVAFARNPSSRSFASGTNVSPPVQ